MKRALLTLALIIAAPAAVVSAGNPATEAVHTVKAGESLNGIANRAGVDKSIIAIANGLQEPYSVQKGQRLQIPRQRSHRVKSGESLSRIAEKYQVPQSNIATANGLAKPNDIRIGRKLIIPAIVKNPPPAVRARSTPYFSRPHNGKVLLGYAMRPSGKGHDGLDIAVNRGDMISASSSGIVEFAGKESTRFGNMVIIDHGMGYKTLYGHLATVTVKKGEYVKSGERIGTGGDAGTATRPELHFEIRRGGKEINPAPRLPARKGS